MSSKRVGISKTRTPLPKLSIIMSLFFSSAIISLSYSYVPFWVMPLSPPLPMTSTDDYCRAIGIRWFISQVKKKTTGTVRK
jgi:hypothetical protein